MITPEVRRKVVRWGTRIAFVVAVVAFITWMARPQHVVVELKGDPVARYLPGAPRASDGVHAMGTFHTQNLLVDNTAQINGTITLQTGIGQPALFTTTHPATADGKNICIGGGCQLLAVNPVGVYTASRNVSLGIDALADNVSGYDNIAIGTDALQHNIGVNAGLGPNQGHDNIAIGNHAMLANLIGEDNIAIGGGALALNQLSRNNVAIGFQALAANTAQENIAIGTNALLANTTGTQNIAIGVTLVANQTGVDNIVMGHDSMGSCIACNDNIAIGVDVLQNNNSVQNVGIGTFALRVNTGYNNIGIGIAAGGASTSGHDNTFVGSSTGGGITTGTSNTILGANVTGLASGLSNNVILADGDGNVKLRDTGTTLYTTEKFGVGLATAPPYASAAQNWIENTSATTSDALIIDDIVDNHVPVGGTFDGLHVHSSGTFDTSATDQNAVGVRIINDALPTVGTHILNNVGLLIDTNNGDTNTAIHVIHGTTRLDETLAATDITATTIHTTGNFDVNTDRFTVDATTGNTSSIGLMTLSNTTESLWAEGRIYLGGTTKGDTAYGINGSINKGYENNSEDSLVLNFYGYHQAFSQPRNLKIDDGMGQEMVTVKGATGHVVYTSEGHTAPTGSASCNTGGGGSITGTDNLMKLITGTGSTACTITFGASWGASGTVCTIFPSAGVALPTCTINGNAITCTVVASSATYGIFCGGLPGAV